MFVVNKSKKTIGFGNMYLVPGAAGKLPAGFTADHPTVAYYVKKKWIMEIDPTVAPDETAEKLENFPELTKEEKELIEAGKAAAAKAAERDKMLKEIGKLNLEPLRAKATELGVEFTEQDTKAVLFAKISDKIKAEQE